MDINSYNNYKIKRETMTLIADKLRAVVGKTAKLTPEEIAYYIDRIIFTPQSFATNEFMLDFTSNTNVVLPTVYKGVASNTFALNFTSSATGALQED